MIQQIDRELIISSYIGQSFEDKLLEEIYFSSEIHRIKEGQRIVNRGDTIPFIPILLSGSIKVMSNDRDDKELLLYYLESGDTCAVTLKCCAENASSKVSAYAEEDSVLLAIPRDKMDTWLSQYHSWRNFVLESFSDRLNEMIAAIDSLAFQDLESRLKQYLMNKVWIKHDRALSISHKQIAQELNTSREVISRLMKKLEYQKSIEQSRNKVTLLEKLKLK